MLLLDLHERGFRFVTDKVFVGQCLRTPSMTAKCFCIIACFAVMSLVVGVCLPAAVPISIQVLQEEWEKYLLGKADLHRMRQRPKKRSNANKMQGKGGEKDAGGWLATSKGGRDGRDAKTVNSTRAALKAGGESGERAIEEQVHDRY